MKFRVMKYNKPVPEWEESDFCASAGLFDGTYNLASDLLRVNLTREERDRTVATWAKCDVLHDAWRARHGDAPVDHSNPEYEAFMAEGMRKP